MNSKKQRTFLIPFMAEISENNNGVTAIIVGIALLMLVSFAALAIDLSHLFVVRNELQNAADAGALAGARFLYVPDGSMVNINTNQNGYDAATANNSENVSVDVHGLQEGDVQRGHWSFTTGEFTASASTALVDLNRSADALDTDPDFINAVKVTTRREDTPAASFLAGIFGSNSFIMKAEAVAYKGFAGSFGAGEADMPITICEESILVDGAYSCSIGRMINSGQNEQTSETGGWTSYAQQREEGDPDPCLGGTNAHEVSEIIDPPGPDSCFGENYDPIIVGKNMSTIGGEVESIMSRIRDCWLEASDSNDDGLPDQSWNLTLPVVACPSNNVGVCEMVVGAVNVNVVWVSGAGESTCNFSASNLPPINIDDWSCEFQPPSTEAQMQACWDSFVSHFNLQNVDNTIAACAKKSLYFKPDCSEHEPIGTTGGAPFGIMADIPVLVK